MILPYDPAAVSIGGDERLPLRVSSLWSLRGQRSKICDEVLLVSRRQARIAGSQRGHHVMAALLSPLEFVRIHPLSRFGMATSLGLSTKNIGIAIGPLRREWTAE
jgi:hypothetical protein